MSKQPIISIVIPLYCEGNHLNRTLSVIQGVLDTLNEPYELILVDDGSIDNTWDIIKKIAQTTHTVKAIRLSRNFGKESAICAGLEQAKGKAVIVMDGDLQHPPELIPEMVELWKKTGANIVEAVKERRGKESILYKLGAKFFYWLMRILSGYDLHGMSDYKLLDRQVVNAWLQMGERNLFFRGMIAYLGFTRNKIYFTPDDRIGGKSKWSLLHLMRFAITNITAFTSIPLHFVTLIGGIFLVFAFFLAGQTLFLKFTGRAVSGFTTVILLLLIIGSLILIGMGIIGEYIARIYEEVKARPRYVIQEMIDREHDASSS